MTDTPKSADCVSVPREPTEAMLAAGVDAFLKDMRDRRLLKWLFAEQDNGAIGYVDGPIALEDQIEGATQSVTRSFKAMLASSPAAPGGEDRGQGTPVPMGEFMGALLRADLAFESGYLDEAHKQLRSAIKSIDAYTSVCATPSPSHECERALEEAATLMDELAASDEVHGDEARANKKDHAVIFWSGSRNAYKIAASRLRNLAQSAPAAGEDKTQTKGGTQWATDLTTKIECAIGGAYEFPDGRQFWIDGPVAREITKRVCAAVVPTPQPVIDGGAVWSELPIEQRSYPCASENCGGQQLYQFVSGDVASRYCAHCTAKICVRMTPRKAP